MNPRQGDRGAHFYRLNGSRAEPPWVAADRPLEKAARAPAWRPRWALALLIGLGCAFVQVSAVMLAAPGSGLEARHRALFQHDSFWFGNIVRRGYASPVPPPALKAYEVANVAFFPGYPVAAAGLGRLLGLSPRGSLFLTAHLALWLFWSYVAAFFLAWRAPFWLALGGAALIAAHPGALFMAAAYSEPLFLAALLGFLFWSARPGAAAGVLAALHGFGMTAARIVGIPCVAAAAWLRKGGWTRKMAVGALSLLGAALFFLFCLARFGAWDLYFQTQRAGWGVEPRWLAPLEWRHYAPFWPYWRNQREMGQAAVMLTPWLYGLAALAEAWAWRRGNRLSRERLAFYFCGAALFYIAAAGMASVRFESMMRYQFCTHVMLVLAILHLLSKTPPRTSRGKAILAGGALALFTVLMVVQGYYAGVYTKGGWVA